MTGMPSSLAKGILTYC